MYNKSTSLLKGSLLATVLLFCILSFAQKSTRSYSLPLIPTKKIEVPENTPILITVAQRSWNAPGTTEFNDTLINHSKYNAIRIGEYYWMDRNLKDKIPMYWAEPWNQGTSWTGLASEVDMNQQRLDDDMGRLFLDKSQFQINIEDFHTYYGRYYTRTDVEYITRGKNLKVLEGIDKMQTAWKMPKNNDFRQLFAMCPVPSYGSLGQVDVRIALSCKRNENPLAYDIHDPNGGMMYRTYWFEYSSNLHGFNMMPGGSRLNGDGWIINGLGPNNGGWWGLRGDIYHLFHTAKYATDGAQVTIHDWLNTKEGTSWHWYNVRLCRELTDEELGYKLYINVENYDEGYEQTIKELKVSEVDIIQLALDEEPPLGYYELPKGYLRGFYVQYVLGKKRPEKYIKQIVEYLKQVDDDIFYDANNQQVPYIRENDESLSRNTSSLAVYPNPMESTLYVDLEDTDDEVLSIQIHNLYGLQQLHTQGLEQYNDIDVSKLPVGLHFLRVHTRKGDQTFKMIKK